MRDDEDRIKQLNDLISNDAPGLAAILLGPNAPIAISALGKALLGDSEASLEAVTDKAQSADKVKILAAEQEAQLRLRQSDAGPLDSLTPHVQEIRQAYADTQAARQRQIDSHDWTNRWLAFIVSGAFFGLIVILIFGPDTSSRGTRDLLFTLLGVVATGWANIVGFYFGSSAGSLQKSQTIDAVLSRSSSNIQSHIPS
jgi:hypothetical protein